MDSSYWIRYSDYEIIKDERRMDCIKPTANAVPIAYDVAARLDFYAAELMNIALDDSDVLQRSLRFVKRFGLLGLALEQDNYLTLPEVKANMSEAVFAVTDRHGDNYAGVFSREYYEKAANISTWLDWLVVQYNKAITMRNGRMVSEPFSALTLHTMLETGLKKALSDKTIKPCPICSKVFFDPDEHTETCSEQCKRVYDNVKHLEWMKENFHSKPIAGG